MLFSQKSGPEDGNGLRGCEHLGLPVTRLTSSCKSPTASWCRFPNKATLWPCITGARAFPASLNAEVLLIPGLTAPEARPTRAQPPALPDMVFDMV